jgi:hypothetical protein
MPCHTDDICSSGRVDPEPCVLMHNVSGRIGGSKRSKAAGACQSVRSQVVSNKRSQCTTIGIQAVESEDESGPDDEDLYAFTSLADSPDQAASSSQEAQQQEGSSTGQTQPTSRQPGGFGGPTAFASLTLGMNHAVVQLNRAFQQMAMRAQHRRCLTRPS